MIGICLHALHTFLQPTSFVYTYPASFLGVDISTEKLGNTDMDMHGGSKADSHNQEVSILVNTTPFCLRPETFVR